MRLWASDEAAFTTSSITAVSFAVRWLRKNERLPTRMSAAADVVLEEHHDDEHEVREHRVEDAERRDEAEASREEVRAEEHAHAERHLHRPRALEEEQDDVDEERDDADVERVLEDEKRVAREELAELAEGLDPELVEDVDHGAPSEALAARRTASATSTA